ncbi:MAG: endonuclease domain-containing protein [Cardiobacteriaceae bacterium]|nr:endonuclease domain-containing protein [Cardiobacteriaceae bacterium]
MTPAEKILPRRAALLPQAKKLRIRMTDAEQSLWQHLRAGRLQGYKFRRQQPIGDYIVDFLCLAPKLVVEADGGQHGEQQAYDQARTAYLQSLGFTVLRFWNHEILQQTESVLDAILQRLRELDGRDGEMDDAQLL